jgi:hypothetical protein
VVFDRKRLKVVLDGEMRSCDGRDKDFRQCGADEASR